ncbi:DUF3023 domain-containing protein [Ehrlichia canis]|uniref:Uncharacterized protein n=1 Tax=Ehrlichia canis (strain Jake) TaxID=269484 RepID=A0ACA6AVT3_EHRCJ|nr:DUF3023 domain-containing protein [Ehrlichia canis]AAZ68466.1 hypothetical protein Ecaj_0423 [Ehrlichia canis str. Jake]
MLGYDSENKVFINEQLSEELVQTSETEGLICIRCYCVGNSSSGRLKVCVNEEQCFNNEIPVDGQSVVCCEFILPDRICDHQLVRKTIDNTLKVQYVKCYLVIAKEQSQKFFNEVYKNFLLESPMRLKVCNIRQYGNVCLSMLTNTQLYTESMKEAFGIIKFNAEFVEYSKQVIMFHSKGQKQHNKNQECGATGTTVVGMCKKAFKSFSRRVKKNVGEHDEQRLVCEKDEYDDGQDRPMVLGSKETTADRWGGGGKYK